MRAALLLAALALASPAYGQTDLEQGFAGALKGCEEWVLNPASWSGGFAPFVSAVGLSDKMALVDSVDEAALPPAPLRRANHYWRINSTKGAGFILVVSDQLPMCHITGGGDTDLEPAVESVIAAPAFSAHWQHVKDQSRDDMISSEFRSRGEPGFSLVISRAKKPNERLDRVQVVATAVFDTSK